MDDKHVYRQPVIRLAKIKALPFGESEANEDIFFQDAPPAVLLHDPKSRRNAAPVEYPVDFVYGPLAKAEDVFHRHIQPLVEAFVDGVDATLLVFGPDGGGKSSLLEGPRGLEALAAAAAFQFLEQKGATDKAGFSFSVKIRYLEVYNEHVTDLLSRTPGSVVVSPVDTVDGTQLQNATGLTVNGAEDVVGTLQGAAQKRNMSAKHKTTTCMQMELLQSFSKQGWSACSRLTVVESLGTDCLAMDRDAVQMSEGFNAFRSAFSLSDVVNSWQTNSIADASRALLPWLVAPMLTQGNALCCAILCLQQNQYERSKAGLDLLLNMGRLVTHPTCVDNRVLGFVRALRREILQTRQAHKAASALAPGAELHEKTKKHIHDLEGRLVAEELSKAKALDEQRRLQSKLEEMKEKYKRAIEAQLAAQKSLVGSEEDRLKVCQALVTLQIEATKAKDEASQQKYADASKLVTYEQDVVDLTLQNKTKAEQLTALEKKAEALEAERRQLEIELAAARRTLLQLRDEYQMERKRNEELSVEVVNLMNAKGELERRLDSLTKAQKHKDDEVGSLRDALEGRTKGEESLRGRVQQMEEAITTLTAEKMRTEVEFERYRVDVENAKLGEKRSLQDLEREKDAGLMRLQRERAADLESLAEQLKVARDAEAALQRQLRAALRQLKETERKEEAAKDAEALLRERMATLERDLQNLRCEHQRAIARIARQAAADEREGGNGPPPGAAVSRPRSPAPSAGPAPSVAAMRATAGFGVTFSPGRKFRGGEEREASEVGGLGSPGAPSRAGGGGGVPGVSSGEELLDLVTSLQALHAEACLRESRLQKERRVLELQVRKMQDRLIKMHSVALDWMPEGTDPRLSDQLRADVQDAQRETSAAVDAAERREAELETEVQDLRQQLTRAVKEVTESRVEAHGLMKRKEREMAENQVELLALRKFRDEVESATGLSAVPGMTRQIIKELETLRRGGVGEGGGLGKEEASKLASLSREELLRRCVHFMEENKTLKMGVPKDAKELQQRVKFLEKMLQKSEAERSELISRATIAEEQLQELQRHVRTMTADYQKQIARLQGPRQTSTRGGGGGLLN
uniref:Kinesin motor domain-containing protein n=1 Tax=Chromera velia CCMP2878 TaxID=1169474 RepID=A0A0G4I8R4_9ALVE|eukprot:Cvel_12031.t1-p1 / transcript=Cvel_12031.t1 / gene=Cvel_12031 / organism=Chromera_velia_CCMP2878 / gene_product=Chromosome-associated kinesin KIF4B, putative / transcript_product=Chromosome-associated kinesin KIF4B, putative / location=Cvel_scaffold772:45762-56925(+) / protein_length=1091 / sequence_SO=supercontig / SO=protein_coding / is_pseudo=false